MLALIDCVQTPGRFGKSRREVVSRRVCGFQCLELQAALPAKASSRRRDRALSEWGKLLRDLGAREVCFKFGSSFQQELLDMEFRLLTPESLLKAKAAEVIERAAPEGSHVLLSCRRWDRWSAETFRSLCTKFRYVTVDVPGHVLSHVNDIAGEYGVSPTVIRKDRVVDADGAVFFDVPDRPCFLSGRCMVLMAGKRAPNVFGGRQIERIVFGFPESLRGELPEGYPQDALMSWAIELGRISPSQVRVVIAGQ